MIVRRRRVLRSEHEQQQNDQRKVQPLREDHPSHCRSQYRIGDVMSLSADERVKDVSAVELPDGQKVKGRDEDADPPREERRVDRDVLAGTIGAVNRSDDPANQQWIAVPYDHWIGRNVKDLRGHYAVNQNRQRDDQPGERTCDSDIEHLTAICTASVLKNHRSHCAERRDRKWNEEWERRRNTMPDRLQKMTHLVGEQDSHQTGRENEAVGKIGSKARRRLPRLCDVTRNRDEDRQLIPKDSANVSDFKADEKCADAGRKKEGQR